MTQQTRTNSKTWLGIVLVALGSYFLLRNFNLIPSFLPYWIFSWETIFVVIGGAMLVTGRREGLIFLGIGVFFLLPDILDVPRFRVRDWWPAILIIIGLSIFLRKRHSQVMQPGDLSNDFIEDTSVFGGSEKTVTSRNLKGGKITSIFGGSELNLVDVELGKKEVLIDYFCMFGGNEVTVPHDWTVINESVVVFGSFTDRRSNSHVVQDPDKVLRIKGLILFGGFEVRRG
ncbi:LiaF transmembrane domain-containing protein [Ekhidna sp.]